MAICGACGTTYKLQNKPNVRILYSLEPWIWRSLELCPNCSEEVLRIVAANTQLKEDSHDEQK